MLQYLLLIVILFVCPIIVFLEQDLVKILLDRRVMVDKRSVIPDEIGVMR